MNHKFVILRKGKLETFTDYNLIPKDLDHVIEFSPHVPPPPHTHEQHEEIDGWMDKFKKLLEIEEKNGCNSSSPTS
jgi:hypothetical protein